MKKGSIKQYLKQSESKNKNQFVIFCSIFFNLINFYSCNVCVLSRESGKKENGLANPKVLSTL